MEPQVFDHNKSNNNTLSSQPPPPDQLPPPPPPSSSEDDHNHAPPMLATMDPVHHNHPMDPYHDMMTVRISSLDRNGGGHMLQHPHPSHHHHQLDHQDSSNSTSMLHLGHLRLMDATVTGGDHQIDNNGGFEHLNHMNMHPQTVNPHETAILMRQLTEDHEAKYRGVPGQGKEKHKYLRKYSAKFGLNERGFQVACVLAAISCLLFIAVIAMIICWPASPLRHEGPLHLCTRPPCLRAAAQIIQKQNASVDPCKDFFNYACGNWLSDEGIPETKSFWSTLSSALFSMKVEKSRIISMSSHEPSEFNSIEWKVQNFYQSCMALSFIESDREKPIIKIINSLGGWDVLRSFNLYSWDSHRVLRELHSEHYVNAFFSISVVRDVHNPTRNIIQVSPDGLGMPDKSYYHRLPDDPAVQAYQSFMKDSAQLFGASSPEARKFSVDMFNFEKRISEITPDSDYMNNPMKTNNRMSVKDLHTMSMNIPWLEIFKAAYTDAPLSEETEVVVVSPQYAADIAVIISTTDRASLNNYLMWRLVQAYMPYLSKTFREVVDLYRKALTGAAKPLERWEFCADVTERFFGHLLNALYAKDLPNWQNRQANVKKLFDYIKHNVAKSISVSSSYDFTSRRAAISKLKNITIQIGTPNFLMDRKYLKMMYNHLLVQKTDFFQNIQYGVMFLRKREELALVSPSEESSWLDLLLDGDSVSYSPSANKVVVPEVFLRPPFFHVGYPNSVNMGGLGIRLANAVIQGVSGYGLLFDTTGMLQYQQQNLPTNNATEIMFRKPLNAFESSANCLSDQYLSQGLDTPDHVFKSRRQSVLSLAAMKQALISLEDILDLEDGQLMPAMETYDPQAVFFLSHAQTLCVKRTFKQRDLDRTSPSKSGKFRLLEEEELRGEISRTSEFQHFFFCSTGSSEASSSNSECSGIM